MTQRLVKHPYLAIFDGPDTNASTDVRTHSTVPLQALYLMNNPFVQEQARGLANRLIASSTEPACEDRAGLPTRVGPASRTGGDRASEPSSSIKLSQRYRQPTHRESPREADAWTSLAKVLLTANEFLYID